MAITLSNCSCVSSSETCLRIFLSKGNVGPTKCTFLVKWTKWIRTCYIKNQKKQKKPLSVVLQNKYSTTLLKINEKKMWGSLIVKLQAELPHVCFFGIFSNISDEINEQYIFWGEPNLDENLPMNDPVFFLRFVHIKIEADYFSL